MLTTGDDILHLDNINLDTSNTNNIGTISLLLLNMVNTNIYFILAGHEDFLQQLSAELDIPMLLEQNGSVLQFENCSSDDLLSEV